ncbi:molybdenum cofactor guanylyltransferase [Sphingomonas sp. 8AM]|uniref:molybdenum cofactor guanylyltransferase n=1 Tax=Sphingomonas sp. 8AM TaxID=2653170 RepID=UPI0012EFBDA0|nr:molybdenum cofactor guanylyltransferase [Sphingomonas sp. 8AM]VXC47805.1 Molybdenum cofactor guanylyltransferase [Sphingomonas sp. 8AM]
MKLLGAVLAGGRATRFGSDKALAALDGRALIDHAITSLGAHCDTIVVVGRASASVTCIPDLPFSDLGPLGGIAGALAYAADHGFEAALTTACDTPCLPDAVIVALRAAAPAYAAEAPTVGLWPARFATPLLTHLLADQPRAIRRWAETIGATAVLPGVVLPNINTPNDLTDLLSSRT